MKLIRSLSQHPKMRSVITIGNFDGVHKGHQKLIQCVSEASHELNLPSVLMTFQPHPSEFFQKQTPMPRLMRFSEKWRALEKYHIDYFCCLPFNAALANLSAEDFVKHILVDQWGVKKVIIGDDFRFGAKRLGDVNLLKTLGKQYDFEVIAIPQLFHADERISSTRIREALQKGDFHSVFELTGRPFSLAGKVAYGSQMGRQLGFPTANIHLHRKQVPLMGIFIVRVKGLDNRILPGVASVGYRPTFNGKQILLEVFLFDFEQMIYGRRITVEFIEKIRDEAYFDSVDALIVQMQKDVAVAKQYFKIWFC